MALNSKLEQLKEYLKNLESIVVAFSSGVDSTFLLKVAHDTLDKNVIAVTTKSCSFPNRELNEAIEFCKKELFTRIQSIAKVNGIKNIIEGSFQYCPN